MFTHIQTHFCPTVSRTPSPTLSRTPSFDVNQEGPLGSHGDRIGPQVLDRLSADDVSHGVSFLVSNGMGDGVGGGGH